MIDDVGCGARAALDESQGTSWSPLVQLESDGSVSPKGGDVGRRLGAFNVVPIASEAGDGVRYVRVSLLGPQIDPVADCSPPQDTGCAFMDMAEFALYGHESS